MNAAGLRLILENLVDNFVNFVPLGTVLVAMLGVGVAAELSAEGALVSVAGGGDTLAALFGCLYAGVIAIPAPPPEASRLRWSLPRLQAIVDDADATWPLYVDPLLSEFVTDVNAVDAVAARHGSQGSGRVTVDLEAPSGQSLTLRVSDNGAGIPVDRLDKVFDMFFTTKGDQGTGLGLANVYANIEAHGGHISVEQGKLGGARFTISLLSD